MRIAILVPARYGSTRFPGKPLAMLGGQTVLSRVVENAKEAGADAGADVYVTSDDQRIADHAAELDVPCLMTPESCRTGSDRVWAAAQALDPLPDLVLNLQGDAPLIPASVIKAVIDGAYASSADIITPAVQLSWDDLDIFREHKKETPHSGTTVVHNDQYEAFWFSKNLLPAIRNENKLREASQLSPVLRHIGMYAYRIEALEKFAQLPESQYEKLEGLEQLRALENRMRIQVVPVSLPSLAFMSGIDTQEDLAKAEKLLAAHG
jgi:3-deoxy-manno-octulosonate cytidylyltransferase (CMP-KDO synthetase)